MKKSVIFGVVGIVIIGIIFTIWYVQRGLDKPVEVEYKGIWFPALLFQDQNYLASNIQKLKDMGVNTIFIEAPVPYPKSWSEKAKEVFPPELIKRIEETLPFGKEIIINNIQTAHKNDLKVALTLGLYPRPRLEEIDLEAWNSKIIEYAKLAEEYNVELFAPMSEPGVIFGKDTGKWRQEILPRIKEVYHGEVFWQGAGVGLPEKELTKEFLKELSEGPPGDFSGYDYRGFGSMLRSEGQTLEEYSQYVDNVLKYVLALAERDNCKGVMITEFGVSEGRLGSEEETARAHEIVLEKGKSKVVGFFANSFFLGVELPGMILEEEPKTEEVIRRWYTEIL